MDVVWDNIVDGAKFALVKMLKVVNIMISKLNEFSYTLPTYDIPGLGKVGGQTIGFDVPTIKIPELDVGKVAGRETITGASAKEAAAQENAAATKAVLDATAALIKNSEINRQGDSGGDTNYFTIGTLIGDDRSIKELERRLNATRLLERQRTGVVAYGV